MANTIESVEEFISTVNSQVEGYSNYLAAEWNDIQDVFLKGEEKLLMITYDNEKQEQGINSQIITSAGELAFCVAWLCSEENVDAMYESTIQVFDSTFDCIYSFYTSSLEKDEEDEDEDEE